MVWSISQRIARGGSRGSGSAGRGRGGSGAGARGAVAVDGEDGAVDGSVSTRAQEGALGEGAGGVRVDRGAPDEVGGCLVAAEEGEGGDDHLHLRADRAERAGPVAGGGRVEGGNSGEQQIAEHVRTDLVDASGVVIAGASGIDDRVERAA
jgi:hypothetical protein